MKDVAMPQKKSSSRPGRGAARTPRPEKVLEPVTHGELVEALRRCVHFTGKATNTTIEAVGVRLGGEVRPRPVARRVPRFLSARGIAGDAGGAHALAVDFLFGGAAGRDAKLAGQAATVSGPGVATQSPSVQALYSDAMRSVTQVPATLGADVLDARLRQVLLPWGKAEGPSVYLAATPLSSGAVGRLVEQALERIAQRAEELQAGQTQPRAQRAAYPIGGTKPQNAGVLTRHLVGPWVQPVPSATLEARAAMAIFHGALHWPPLGAAARAFAAAAEARAGGCDTKARLEGIARRVAARVLAVGAEARQKLLRHGFGNEAGAPCLAESATDSERVGPWVRAAKHPRTPRWARAMAAETVRRLQAASWIREGLHVRVIAPDDFETWHGFVHGVLVECYLEGHA